MFSAQKIVWQAESMYKHLRVLRGLMETISVLELIKSFHIWKQQQPLRLCGMYHLNFVELPNGDKPIIHVWSYFVVFYFFISSIRLLTT